jgi:sugar phosphate isomerase/epimerase
MELGVNAVMLPELDFAQQIELCVSAKLRYYQYRPRHIPADQRDKPFGFWGNHRFDLTPERLLAEGVELTRQLRSAGLEPWGTAPALNVDAADEQILLHIRGAAAAEARCIRCNPPAYPRGVFDYPAYLADTIARYRHAVALAAPYGIKLIIETHSGTAACSPALAWNICRDFDPRELGLIMDIANFHREGEINPLLAVSIIGRHIDCVHIGGSRRVKSKRDEAGCAVTALEFCDLREADSYIPAWIQAIKSARPDVPLIIEDYERGVASNVRLRRCAELLHAL